MEVETTSESGGILILSNSLMETEGGMQGGFEITCKIFLTAIPAIRDDILKM